MTNLLIKMCLFILLFHFFSIVIQDLEPLTKARCCMKLELEFFLNILTKLTEAF